MVDPKLRRRGIGQAAVEATLPIIFEERDYLEVRAWIMSDKQAGDWSKNFNFFRKLGFETVQGPYRHWPEYAQERGWETYNRDALWLGLKRDKWKKRTKSKKKTL